MFSFGRRVAAIVLDVGVKPPDAVPYTFLGPALMVCEGIQLVNEPLAMDPAQGMIANPELACAIGDDDHAIEQAQRRDPAPQGSLAGDPHRVGTDFKFGKPKLFKMRHPGIPAGKEAGLTSGQLLDEHGRQAAVAHVIERRVIDLVAFVAGAQQFQKVQPAL